MNIMFASLIYYGNQGENAGGIMCDLDVEWDRIFLSEPFLNFDYIGCVQFDNGDGTGMSTHIHNMC